MNKTGLILIVTLLCLNTSVWSAAGIETDQQKLSYALGVYFSQGIKQQKTDLDIPAFLQAVEDSLTGADLKISESEVQTALNQYKEKLVSERNVAAGVNKTAGQKFLDENKSREGVVALPSGVQYKILKEGAGDKPSSDSKVNVHYQGSLVNGQVFDSSYERGEPVSLGLNQVIKGWQEILPLMSAGSKWQVYIPPELAYGERGAGAAIGPNETLIFDIELIGIE